MSKRLKKVISVTTSVTTVVWLSGIAAFAPIAATAATINEGDTIKTADNPDVYIAKYVGAKKFKRLILSPNVFNSYGHLSWSKIKTVSQAEMDAFTTSELVRAVGDPKVYKLTPEPNSDNGQKQWVNMTAEAFTAGGWDWDSIYEINTVDRDSYAQASTEIVGGTPSNPTTAGASGAAGTLTVSLASDTPAAGVAVKNAARVPFTKVNLTAGSSAVTVNGLTVQRTGLADDAAISSVALIDASTGLQVGLNQTLNAAHQVTFNEAITIPANTTKSYILAANMLAALTNYAGQIASLSLVGVNTAATISGTLPITGNGQTLNATLSIGAATVAVGSLDPISAAKKEVGTTNYTFASVKVSADSAEDVTIYSIKFNQSGSAASSDIANVIVSDGSTNYATTVSSDGKYYTATFGTGITIAKGLSKEFTVKGDILSGSNRTVSFDIYKNTDVVVKGNTYGYYMIPSFTDYSAAGSGTYVQSSASPYFGGSDVTIGAGSLRVDKSASGAPAGTVTKGATGVLLGAFDFVVQGEPVNVTSMVLDVTVTGTGKAADITNVTLTKADGTVVAGPVNVSDTTATFTGTVTFPVGTNQVLVKGNLNTNLAADDTIAVSFNTPQTKVTGITGQTTGNSLTATPASAITANTMTVKGGGLTVSVSGTPVTQTVIKGATGFTFANFVFDASASGEDVRVTSMTIRQVVDDAANVNAVTSMQLWDGSTALNTGSNVKNPDGDSDTNDYVFTLDTPLVITKGTQKTVALKGNVSASGAGTQQWGLQNGSAMSAIGVSTGQEIGETINTGAGQVMTLASSGQYSVALDSSTPTGKLIAANTTGNVMTVLKFAATSETINISKIRLALTNASSTGIDLANVYVYDGSTQLASGVFQGAGGVASTTFTLSPALVVNANEEKVVTIKADIAPIYTSNTVATAGHQVAIDFYGSTSTSENLGTGASSGTSIANYSPTTSQTPAIIMKSVPTVSKLALTSTILSNGTIPVYKFRVAADAKGDIDLYKFTFQVATTSATATNFVLYNVSASPEAQVNADKTSTANNADMDMVLENASGTDTQITIPAGTYKDFELRATVAGVSTGSSLSVQLQGDAAKPAAMSGGLMTASAVDSDADNDDFIWSDISKSSHSASTADWFNGYLVSGLPSSNLAAEVLSGR